jgi:serine/threonine protein phosphatase PrpC
MGSLRIIIDVDIPDENAGKVAEILSLKKDEINSIVLDLLNDFNPKKLELTFSDKGTRTENKDNSSQIFNSVLENDKQPAASSEAFQLPNGMVNKEYDFHFIPGWNNLNDFQILRAPALTELGLSFINETNSITGKPIKDGEFSIPFDYQISDKSGKIVIQKGTIKLLINSDPRSLWKDFPTPATVEYYKPDQTNDFIKVQEKAGDKFPSKNIIAASKRGRSHGYEGKARDDDFLIRYNHKSGWYFIAAADGAGSAQVSRKGSEIACRTMIESCRFKFEEQSEILEKTISEFNNDKKEENRKKVGDALYKIIGNSVLRTLKDIEDEARSRSRSIKDYSTTLLFTACKKFDFGWFVTSFWIGDGGIGLYNKETQYLKILGVPDSGQYAGQTCFLTSEMLNASEIYHRLRFEILDDFSALILMTDGVTDPKFETDSNLNDVNRWNDLWSDIFNSVDFSGELPKTSQQLLSWLDFWSPGNHDDRTIVILH